MSTTYTATPPTAYQLACRLSDDELLHAVAVGCLDDEATKIERDMGWAAIERLTRLYDLEARLELSEYGNAYGVGDGLTHAEAVIRYASEAIARERAELETCDGCWRFNDECICHELETCDRCKATLHQDDLTHDCDALLAEHLAWVAKYHSPPMSNGDEF